MAYPLRTRFKKEIVAEFLPPRGYPKQKKNRVIIFCGGMPTVPSWRPVLEFFSKKGFWAFAPRCRGSWESGGRFLAKSPERDVLDIADELPKGFRSARDGERFAVRPDALYVLGVSFGGAAAILASRDPRVTKAVALAPVTDWRVESKTEPFAFMARFTKEAFGEAYRGGENGWKKLKTGRFYNPAREAARTDGRKILIIHAKDDDVVPWRPSARFAKQVGASFVPLKRGGHFGSRQFIEPRYYKKIARFLKQ